MERIITTNYHLQAIWQKLIGADNYGRVSTLKSQYYCGKVPASFYIAGKKVSKNIEVKTNGKTAHYNGTMKCRNTWTCPVCVPTIMRKHADKITSILKKEKSEGNVAVMMTLTIPHYKHQSAKQVLDQLSTLSRAFLHGYYWRQLKKSIHIKGLIWSDECTYGKNGFHFHRHALIVLPETSLESLSAVEPRLISEWQLRFMKLGYEMTEYAFEGSPGVFLSRDLNNNLLTTKTGDYICWDGVSEVTASQYKNTKEETSRSMFQLLEGDAEDKRKFMEFAQATYGRKRIFYSRCFKVNIEEVENIDDDPKKADGGGEFTTVAVFNQSQWGEMMKYENDTSEPMRAEIIKLAIISGYAGIRAFLMERGLDPPFASIEELQEFENRSLKTINI